MCIDLTGLCGSSAERRGSPPTDASHSPQPLLACRPTKIEDGSKMDPTKVGPAKDRWAGVDTQLDCPR